MELKTISSWLSTCSQVIRPWLLKIQHGKPCHTFAKLDVLNTLIEDSLVVLISYYAPNEAKDQLKVLDDLNHILNNIDISEDRLTLF